MSEIKPRAQHPDVEHEASDVNPRVIATFGATLFGVAVVIYVIVWLLFDFFAAQSARKTTAEYPLAIGQQHRLPPEPRLQTNPRGDLLDLRTSEDKILNGYGWIDKNAGIVRIPIADAMRLTLAHGLPARPGGAVPDEHASSGDANSGRDLVRESRK